MEKSLGFEVVWATVSCIDIFNFVSLAHCTQVAMIWGRYPATSYVLLAKGPGAKPRYMFVNSAESWSICAALYAQDLSFTAAREMLEKGSQAGLSSIMEFMYSDFEIPCQELKRHGASLQGPSEKLRRAGAGGRWPSNVERDTLRTLGGGALNTDPWPLNL